MKYFLAPKDVKPIDFVVTRQHGMENNLYMQNITDDVTVYHNLSSRVAALMLMCIHEIKDTYHDNIDSR